MEYYIKGLYEDEIVYYKGQQTNEGFIYYDLTNDFKKAKFFKNKKDALNICKKLDISFKVYQNKKATN